MCGGWLSVSFSPPLLCWYINAWLRHLLRLASFIIVSCFWGTIGATLAVNVVIRGSRSRRRCPRPTHAAFRSLCTNQRTSALVGLRPGGLGEFGREGRVGVQLQPLPQTWQLTHLFLSLYSCKPSGGFKNKCLPSFASFRSAPHSPWPLPPYRPTGNPSVVVAFHLYLLFLVTLRANPPHSFHLLLLFLRFSFAFYFCIFYVFSSLLPSPFWPDLSPFIRHCQSSVVFVVDTATTLSTQGGA